MAERGKNGQREWEGKDRIGRGRAGGGAVCLSPAGKPDILENQWFRQILAVRN
jgi:hypothetical protein